MSSVRIQRPDAPESKSDASASGQGRAPRIADVASSEHRERIAAKAYEIAERRGFVPGGEVEDWLQAERELDAGAPRNTPPDNPFDPVKTYSNE